MSEAERITRALGGRWYRSYGLAYCPAHENRWTPALRLGNGRAGRLLALCSAGCDFRDIADAIRARGLLDGTGRAHEPDPAAERRRMAKERAEREQAIRRACNVWNEARPITGTLAEWYLRARAIRSPLPDTLRFHPAAWHGASATKHPAMVAAIVHAGETVAVHRTFLVEPGRKADIAPAKMMLGPVQGGAARLSEGAGPLVIAEGIETGLSLLDGLGARSPRVWAALSTSGVSGLALPASPGALFIAPDGDDPGRKAADALASRAHAAGWRVRIMAPPDGRSDWNDAAMGEAA